MSATACAQLRHDVRPRWIGDLLAAYCRDCGCLWVPEPVHRDRPTGGELPASPQPGSLAPLPAAGANG